MRFLITGGAGFIGSNAARRFRELGHEAVVFDNLSRPAARYNLRWLQSVHPDIRFVEGDVRREEDLSVVGREPFDAILHLAAQVAVTTSIADPVADWEANALGTFRVLEAVRRRYASEPENAPLVVYSSTNKVYGHLASGETLRDGRRLPPQLRSSHCFLPPVVHLRSETVRRRGSGLGRLVRARRDVRSAHHDLRRRLTGSRPPLGRRPRGCVSRRRGAARRRGRQGIQHRRRPRFPAVSETAHRNAGATSRTRDRD